VARDAIKEAMDEAYQRLTVENLAFKVANGATQINIGKQRRAAAFLVISSCV
jgi:hypothetical protein